jgi:hypothetical protein
LGQEADCEDYCCAHLNRIFRPARWAGRARTFANLQDFRFQNLPAKLPTENSTNSPHYEYRGQDYDSDMSRLAKDPRNIAGLKQTDATQLPLEGEKNCTVMEWIFLICESKTSRT